MKILVVGGAARTRARLETRALAAAQVVFVAPGNGGTAAIEGCAMCRSPIATHWRISRPRRASA